MVNSKCNLWSDSIDNRELNISKAKQFKYVEYIEKSEPEMANGPILLKIAEHHNGEPEMLDSSENG